MLVSFGRDCMRMAGENAAIMMSKTNDVTLELAFQSHHEDWEVEIINLGENTPLATSLPDQLTLCTHDGVKKIKVCFVGGTITLCGRQTARFDRVTTSGDGSSLHAHGRDPEGKLWSVKLGFTSKSAHPRADCDWDDIELKNLRAQEFEPDTSKEVIHEKKKKKKTIDDDEVWVGIKAWSGGMAVFGLFITWLRSID